MKADHKRGGNDVRREEVLVVDDNLQNLKLLEDILQEAGYQVRLARDGRLAIRSAVLQQPSLILLDIRMPGIDGFEVCRRLKDDERTRSIPIIFITVMENERDKIKGFQAGAVDYITKPFQPEEVLARVRMHLNMREMTGNLEKMVAERTEELNAANKQLQRELAERKEAEKALSHERMLLDRIMETSPVGITVVNSNGLIVFANSQSEKLLGLTKNEITRRRYNAPEWSITDLDGGPFPEEKLPFQQVMGGRKPVYDVQHAIEWPGGRRIILSINGAPIFNERGEIENVVFAIEDITRRRTAEEETLRLNEGLERRVLERTAQLEAANKEMEAFTYSVSHDLRAPLRHIDGFIGLMKKSSGAILNEESLHYMSIISDSAKKMGTLIDNLLSFSRLGRQEISLMQVDLGIIVSDVIGELKKDAAGRAIVWRIGDFPLVRGDAPMLRIVLTNLFSNALKFTGQRDPAVIETGCECREWEAVVFVRDNGVGFNQAYAGKLFGVFQRLHNTEEFEGTGVGLAIAHRIISRQGGRIWAEGETGKGAVFYFSLPLINNGGK